jgi:TPR repeat protein
MSNIQPNLGNNNSLNELSQIIQNFVKLDIKEIEPITQNIHENIFEEDLSIVIDELVNLIFKGLNEGIEEEILKHHVLNYINNQKIIIQEIYDWLLNNQHNSNFICLLGYFNYYGIGTNMNKQKAIKLYQNATLLENSVAQLNLAEMYMYGKGVEIDSDLAFKLYEELSYKKIPNAIDKLGYCYETGIGTNTNWEKAFELFQEAADLGNSNGMNNLGTCYYNGIGTDINDQKAFELYQRAANLDNYVAQCNLALMYEYGNGIGKNITQAIYWYNKSAIQGHQYAQNKLKELKEIK